MTVAISGDLQAIIDAYEAHYLQRGGGDDHWSDGIALQHYWRSWMPLNAQANALLNAFRTSYPAKRRALTLAVLPFTLLACASNVAGETLAGVGSAQPESITSQTSRGEGAATTPTQVSRSGHLMTPLRPAEIWQRFFSRIVDSDDILSSADIQNIFSIDAVHATPGEARAVRWTEGTRDTWDSMAFIFKRHDCGPGRPPFLGRDLCVGPGAVTSLTIITPGDDPPGGADEDCPRLGEIVDRLRADSWAGSITAQDSRPLQLAPSMGPTTELLKVGSRIRLTSRGPGRDACIHMLTIESLGQIPPAASNAPSRTVESSPPVHSSLSFREAWTRVLTTIGSGGPVLTPAAIQSMLGVGEGDVDSQSRALVWKTGELRESLVYELERHDCFSATMPDFENVCRSRLPAISFLIIAHSETTPDEAGAVRGQGCVDVDRFISQLTSSGWREDTDWADPTRGLSAAIPARIFRKAGLYLEVRSIEQRLGACDTVIALHQAQGAIR